MLEFELVEMVNKISQTKSESNYLEIKAARDGCPKLFDTLSSFFNQCGEVIIFGVDEQSRFEVCGVYAPTMGADSAVGERFIDNARIDGNIVNMLDETLKFVRKNMKTATYIDPQTGKHANRTEYPVIAVRELILNELVHRDYSNHTDFMPITVKMFSNRVEIENPGGLYRRMT